MSITTTVKVDKTELIPSVCHIDNTARLQTVNKKDNLLYYKLIHLFFKLTKIPMILNTSFNLKNQPIVETPDDAIRSFKATNGLISTLFMDNFEITLKKFPFSDLNSNNIDDDDKSNDNKTIDNRREMGLLLENELKIVVKGKQFYISEVTSSSYVDSNNAISNSNMRIRIQGTLIGRIFYCFVCICA